MPSVCIVPSCKAPRLQGIRFFKFPSQEERRNEWILALDLNPKDVLNRKDPRVCPKHFPASAFSDSERRHLLKAATPVGKCTNGHTQTRTQNSIGCRDSNENKETQNKSQKKDHFKIKQISAKELEDLFRSVGNLKEKIIDMDPNIDRIVQVHRDIDKAFINYKIMYENITSETDTTVPPCGEDETGPIEGMQVDGLSPPFDTEPIT
ncbi:uncharacterized protein LOC136038790 [Artemia franciscana]|uniref:uncharacterized protein LOC136038790 n=1 Tax=Artemia franciscana TaxID=6661 RepID=UPI0032DAF54E